MDDELNTEIATEEQPAEEQTAESLFSEKLKEIQEARTKPAEAEQVPADADPAEETEGAAEEESPEANPTEVKVEGPTAAMKAVARQHGIPESFIKHAPSDEALDELIRDAIQSREANRDPEPEPIKEPEFTLTLPEEEFAADDPVRKQFDALHSHYAKELKKLSDDLGAVVNWALEKEKSQEESTQQQLAVEQGDFDSTIDALNIPALGNRSGGELGSMAHSLRSAMYFRMKDLEQEHPRTPRQKLIERVIEEAGYQTPEQRRTKAIKDDQAARLGGSPTKPLPEPQLEGEELAISKIREIVARNK